jgi:hypothetical protein
VIRRAVLSLFFGTAVAALAWSLGLAGGSKAQAHLIGLLSALGFSTASLITRGRLRRSQGQAPAMRAGEEALLFGPGELRDEGGSSKAWFYLSNQRLLIRGSGGEAVDIELPQIQELKPFKAGFFSGELGLVAQGKGLLRLKVPDPPRWHKALALALRKEA